MQSKLPKEYSNGKVQVGIVCGSGLGGLATLLKGPIKEFDYKDIPGFGVVLVSLNGFHRGSFV